MQGLEYRRGMGAITVAIVAIAAGMSHAASGDTPRRATIQPSLVNVGPGQEVQFTVILEPSRLNPATVAPDVVWSISSSSSGGEIGEINVDGMYRSPSAISGVHEVSIEAKAPSAANPNLFATVILGDAAPNYGKTGSWSAPEEGDGSLKTPSGIDLDANGDLVISDTKAGKVVRYTRDGRFIQRFGLDPENNPRFTEGPTAVVVGKDRRVYAGDLRTGPPRILIFNADGTYATAFAQKGAGPGRVMHVRDMAIDRAGRIFAADSDNMRINVFSPDGAFIEAWRNEGVLPGQLNAPYGVVVDPSDDVFVSGYYGPCQKFNIAGGFIQAFAHPRPDVGYLYFTSMSGDQWGNVYIAARKAGQDVDRSMHPKGHPVHMLKYNNNGDLVTTFQISESELGESPSVVDESGIVYVLYQREDGCGVDIFAPR